MHINKHFDNLKKEICKNRDILNGLLGLIKHTKKEERLLYLIDVAYEHMIKRFTGYYSSSLLEQKLVQISQKHTLGDLSQTYKKNRFLHVMTICWIAGGHTRIVERWIKNSPEDHEHSVVLIEPLSEEDSTEYIPNELFNVVKERSGELIKLSRSIPKIKKALMLRKIASEYEYVILHTHPHDVIPVLAFGNEEFARPVIFHNGAGQQPWCGVSISDIVAEIRTFDLNRSIKIRGIKNPTVLPISISNTVKKLDKFDCRKKLNLPLNKKIIVTMGAPYKYTSLWEYNFQEMVRDILNKSDDILFVALGPKKDDLNWKELISQFVDRIELKGTVPFDTANEYICAADLYIDSFPFTGGTAFMDAVSKGVPSLSLKLPSGPFDYQEGSNSICSSIDEMVEKSCKILYENYKTDNIMLENINNHHLIYGWRQNLNNLLEKTPKTHKTYKFKEKLSLDIFDLYVYDMTRKLYTEPFDFNFIKLKYKLVFYFYYLKSKLGNIKNNFKKEANNEVIAERI